MSPLFLDGLNITAIGMGVVFVLLTSLVFIIRGMSALSHALGGAADTPQTRPEPVAAGQTANEELIIAISAAIAAHRKQR